MKIADVSIGYGDEFKIVHNKLYAVCKGKKCNICIDWLFIDVSDNVSQIGDEVILLGEGIDIETLVFNCDTIANELYTSFKS